jgi:alginate O-acetyltransferase complex protein AlgI
MLFCTFPFLVFFAVVFTAYWVMPWKRARVWLLLAASFWFYAWWNVWLAGLVLASASLDFLLARGIESDRSPRLRRLLVGVSITANLGLLCYFKYANFFLDSLASLLRLCGVTPALPVLSLIVPVGISFYTFEAISYVVDVARGQLKAERRLDHFLLFILFFPHLVCGPIVRAGEFLPQVNRRKRWSWLRTQAGVQLLLLGLLKKWGLGDLMQEYVNPVFANPGGCSVGSAWWGLLAYALEIYGDFSGYSDMACGLAHLLGYHLRRNFAVPYASRNFAELWRRWHITLSNWLRDYLFIPLGGSRGGRWRLYRNLLLTMALGGLWHGATWNYVLWGTSCGVLLVVYRMFEEFCERRPALDRAMRRAPWGAAAVALTFLAFCLTLVLVRTQSLGQAGAFYASLLGFGEHEVAISRTPILVAALGLVVGHVLGYRDRWKAVADRLPAPILAGAYAALLCVALMLAPGTEKPFIYFQF